MIAVPNQRLKTDWETKLKENGLVGEVVIVNTLIKNTYEVDLLIIDEIHRFAADTFSKTFEVVKYNKVLGLTATLERNDGKHEVILKHLEIVDEIPIEEGLDNGWVDPFEVIKVPVTLTEQELERLNKLNKTYLDVKTTLGKGNPMKNAEYYVKYLDLRKWVIGKKSGKIFFLKQIRDAIDTPISEAQFEALLKERFDKPTKNHILHKKALAAVKFYNTVAFRKDLLYNAENKISKTLELIDKYDSEYKFVFSQRIVFLEKIAKHLPEDKFRMYHSNMKKKKRNESFQHFNEDNNNVRTMLSVKSLIEGIDIPKLSVSIVTSYSSSLIDKTQTWGRTMRKYKDKKATIIYLYVPDTQEQVWLDKILK